MRKRKGAVLPGAILLCLVLLAVTFSTAYLVVHFSTLHRLESIDSSYRTEFLESFTKFQATGSSGSLDGISSENLEYSTKRAEGTANIRALIGKNKGGVLKAYGIYDFDTSEALAYQDKEIYISPSGKLGGLIDWEE